MKELLKAKMSEQETLLNSAIAGNRAMTEYKEWIRDEGEMPKSYFKILCLYLLAFAIIIAAVM